MVISIVALVGYIYRMKAKIEQKLERHQTWINNRLVWNCDIDCDAGRRKTGKFVLYALEYVLLSEFTGQKDPRYDSRLYLSSDNATLSIW